jgi:hypothetical protein
VLSPWTIFDSSRFQCHFHSSSPAVSIKKMNRAFYLPPAGTVFSIISFLCIKSKFEPQSVPVLFSLFTPHCMLSKSMRIVMQSHFYAYLYTHQLMLQINGLEQFAIRNIFLSYITSPYRKSKRISFDLYRQTESKQESFLPILVTLVQMMMVMIVASFL